MRKRPLHHDEEVNLHDQLNRDIGHRVLQLGMSMVKRTVWTMGTASVQRRGRTWTTCTTGTSITVIQQLGNNYGPTNSLDMEICLCATKEICTTCTWDLPENP